MKTLTNFFYFIDDVLKTFFDAQAGEVDQVWLADLDDVSVAPAIRLEHGVVTLDNDF
jgi:hypothetical protein